jgi:hypothetical protein
MSVLLTLQDGRRLSFTGLVNSGRVDRLLSNELAVLLASVKLLVC